MPHLILVRHGQSEWNLEKRFTGWVDVDLTGNGKLEACKAGEYIKQEKFIIDYFFCSFQLRAINTLKLIQDTLRDKREPIKAWQLNERHYGSLQGFVKCDVENEIYGHDSQMVKQWRRNWHAIPPVLDNDDPRWIEEIRKYGRHQEAGEKLDHCQTG